MNKGLIAAGLLSLVTGCSSVRTGFGYRQVSGGHRFYSYDEAIPFVRVQGNRKIERNLEGYLRADFICGEVEAKPEFLQGSAEGHFESVGTGLSYFLTDDFSLDFGGELFRAEFDMKFSDGKFGMTTPDKVFGWGLNLGATFQRSIDDRAFLFISGGYNLTKSFCERSDCDFCGFYCVAGVGMGF